MTVRSLREVRPDARNPVFEWEVTLSLPDGSSRDVKRVGAVEAQYAAAVAPGAELPVRIDPDEPEHFAVDWDNL